jgi:hypothetical protein
MEALNFEVLIDHATWKSYPLLVGRRANQLLA